MSEWIGVDFDRTLVKYDGYKGNLHVGEPIPEMVVLVKKLLEQGKEVRIFTARVSDLPRYDGKPNDIAAATAVIQAWTKNIFGQALKVTNVKDFDCLAIFDDIAFNVIPNTGQIVGDYEQLLVN